MYSLAKFNKHSKPKEPISIFSCHNTTPCISKNLNEIQIMIVDPGIKNLCFRISIYNRTTYKSKTLVFEKIDLSDSKDEGMNIDYYGRMFHEMDKFKDMICNCQFVGVESQIPINYDMVRMGQHIISYLMCITRNEGNKPFILEINPKLKSKMLLAPPKMTKYKLKKWAHEMGVRFLHSSDEHDLANLISGKTKGDDYGDVILMEKVLIIKLNNCELPIPTLIE